MINPISHKTEELLREQLNKIEAFYKADCIYINGPIEPNLLNHTRETIELLKKDRNNSKLFVILTTDGGDAISVERIANLFRHNYKEVNFIIPDRAYSAGTILCMSGDNIFMYYNSVLGPIDPQVQNKEGRFVPALGYLEKINRLLDKATDGTISEAEFLILKDFDLAEISQYEQAKDLTEDLLEKWLVKYKFKNWETHSSSGRPVTEEDKRKRAKEIARELSNYERWKSHGRPLNIEVLTDLKLQIDDFGEDDEIKNTILDFHSMCEDYMRLQGMFGFIFSRRA